MKPYIVAYSVVLFRKHPSTKTFAEIENDNMFKPYAQTSFIVSTIQMPHNSVQPQTL